MPVRNYEKCNVRGNLRNSTVNSANIGREGIKKNQMKYILLIVGLIVFSIFAVRLMKRNHLRSKQTKFSQKQGARKSQRF